MILIYQVIIQQGLHGHRHGTLVCGSPEAYVLWLLGRLLYSAFSRCWSMWPPPLRRWTLPLADSLHVDERSAGVLIGQAGRTFCICSCRGAVGKALRVPRGGQGGWGARVHTPHIQRRSAPPPLCPSTFSPVRKALNAARKYFSLPWGCNHQPFWCMRIEGTLETR